MKSVVLVFCLVLSVTLVCSCKSETRPVTQPAHPQNQKQQPPDEATWTALHQAAVRGDIAEIAKILDEGRIPIDALHPQGNTPLYEAAKRGHLAAVKLLVERGADINIRGNKAGFTPLHVSAEKKHEDVVKYLLSRGADVNARSHDQKTPLHQLSWQRWHGDTQMAEILIAAGAGLNIQDDKGFTPLITSIQYAHFPFARLLVEKGADMNQANSKGNTPLLAAANFGMYEMVKFLVDKGVDINGDPRLPTPLQVASQKGYQDIVSLLKEAGNR